MATTRDSLDKPATSLQPLMKPKTSYNKLSDDVKYDTEPDPNDISLPAKPTRSKTWDNNTSSIRQIKHNRVLFGVAILILTIIVITFIILFTVILDLSENDDERDLLFISHPNSKIYTMDPNRESINNTVESICIDLTSNTFLYVGDKESVYQMCKDMNTASFTELELDESQSILPGLIDAHAHIMSYGEKFYPYQVDLSGATSMDNLRNLIEEFIQETGKNTSEWIRGLL